MFWATCTPLSCLGWWTSQTAQLNATVVVVFYEFSVHAAKLIKIGHFKKVFPKQAIKKMHPIFVLIFWNHSKASKGISWTFPGFTLDLCPTIPNLGPAFGGWCWSSHNICIAKDPTSEFPVNDPTFCLRWSILLCQVCKYWFIYMEILKLKSLKNENCRMRASQKWYSKTWNV